MVAGKIFGAAVLLFGTGALSAPPFLRVDHSASPRRLVDPQGRERLLRGVNLGVEWWDDHGRPYDPAAYEGGRCPPNNHTYGQPPVCGVQAGRGKYNQSTAWDSMNDFAQLRAVGFNVVRLAVSWSLIEPAPLQYNELYLRRIEQVVRWAEEQDVWVIIDFHQDDYSYNVPPPGADGAPGWACPPAEAFAENGTGALPAWQAKFYDKIGLGSSPIVAFDRFWRDETVNATGKGLQEHYIRMAAAVARRFVNSSTVLGYEIMNEPIPDRRLNVFKFANDTLYPFYARFIQALTGARDGLPTCPAAAPSSTALASPRVTRGAMRSQAATF